MAEADFTPDGVTLRLSKEDWWFVSSAMSYALNAHALADHDFRNILMTERADAERLDDWLSEAEREARATGSHWAPTT